MFEGNSIETTSSGIIRLGQRLAAIGIISFTFTEELVFEDMDPEDKTEFPEMREALKEARVKLKIVEWQQNETQSRWRQAEQKK